MANTFLYCWTDTKNNRLYVGSHKGHENDGYICSSKVMMEEYNKRPHDFKREILAHGDFLDIRTLERKILQAADVRNNPDFYNMSYGTENFYAIEKTENHRRKLSEALLGRKCGPKSEETKQKMRKPKSESHRQKMIGNQNAKGVKKTKEVIEKTRLANIGKKRDPKTRLKMKEAQKIRYSCPEQREVQRQAAKKGWETRRKKLEKNG